MPAQVIVGTNAPAEDKIDKLREQIHEKNFTDFEDIRRFIGHYVAANPDQVLSKSPSLLDELLGSIRSELGLGPTAHQEVTEVISAHIRDLITGRAQASEDSGRWSVHRGANQVTMYSGQCNYDAEDIFIDGAGLDFLLHRTYKSQGFYKGPFGVNWDHSYNLSLRELDAGEKLVRLTGAFQESQYTWHVQNNYWVPPPGEHGVIFDLFGPVPQGVLNRPIPPTNPPPRYLLRMPGGTVYLYSRHPNDPAHYVIRWIIDRFGNCLEFSYGAGATGASRLALIAINDARGAGRPSRYAEFAYDTEDRISSITDHTGRIWRYTYDDFGDLVAFTSPATDQYADGLTEQYVYSTPCFPGVLQHKLVQVYDMAGRLYLETEYGTDSGLLSFGRVVRQRQGHGIRLFEYEDVSLVTGLPAGQAEVEEDMPAHQTAMIRRNGHAVHFIYNKSGNLIAKEEDAWTDSVRRRLVTHYRYNRDGAQTAEISPEGRTTERWYGRDEFMARLGVGNIDEEQVSQHPDLTWAARLSFGNRLAVVRRGNRLKGLASFRYPNPMSKPPAIDPHKDIIIKFTYEPIFQQITTISDPRHTVSPDPRHVESILVGDPGHDPNNPDYRDHQQHLTRFEYRLGGELLECIRYPNATRQGQTPVVDIAEKFLRYDLRGRLLEYENRAGTVTQLDYFSANDGPREGYLRRQIIDPTSRNNADGLNLITQYQVNDVGAVTQVKTPKGQMLDLAIDALNRLTEMIRTLPSRIDPVTGALKPQMHYATRYVYCRNMRVERIERDVLDNEGNPLWDGPEVQFFHYDENDNVIREQIGGSQFIDHLVTRHTYDDGDLRVCTVLPRGNRIAIEYDELRRPCEIVRGAGTPEAATVRFSYDGDGLLVGHRDGRGLRADFVHDSFGRTTESRDYDERDQLYRLIRWDYDKAGNLTVERLFVPDGPGVYKLLYYASYEYNELNQLLEIRVCRFQIPVTYSKAEVNAVGHEVPAGEAVRSLYYYDQAGRLIRVEQRGKRLDAAGHPEAAETVLASTYDYNAVGWLTSETDAAGNATETRYDGHGLPTRVDVREAVGNQYSPTGEEVFTTRYEYDELDRLRSITDGLGNSTWFEHDSRDAIIRQTDPLNNVTRFEYDVYGRQVAECVEMTVTGLGSGMQEPNSDVITRYVYDVNGNLVRVIDAHGTPTDQTYDALDRRIGLKYADGTSTTNRYDANGNSVWMSDGDGLIKQATYDPLDRPAEVSIDTSQLRPGCVVEGAIREIFEHDALGQMTRARAEGPAGHWWCDINFKVDSLGHVYEESTRFSDVAKTFTLKREHDDLGFLRRLIYPSGRIVLYGPDSLNRIQRINNQAYGAQYSGETQLPPQRMIVENQYRGLRIGRKVYANNASTTYAYDGAGRVLGIAHSDAQAELLALYYLYDAVGNMRLKYEYAAGRRAVGELYKYDSQYQLTHYATAVPPNAFDLSAFAPRQAPPPDPPQLAGQAEIDQRVGDPAQVPNVFTYRYDKLGNRLEERLPNQPQGVLYVPNTLNQYTAIDGTQFIYDPDGNLCKEHHGFPADLEYVYDHRHQLSRTMANGTDISFRHDALGRRIWSRIDGIETLYLYDRENVIEEQRRLLPREPVGLFSQYVSEFGLDSRCHLAVAGGEYWYHKDLVGSTREMTNGQAIREASYRYTPFGDLADPLPALANPYLFAGRRFLPAIDAYDFRARLYRPHIGRFTTRDVLPRGAATQLYLFARNNPVVRVDPRGEQSGDVNKLRELVREAHDNLAKRDFKSFSAAARRLDSEIEASRARGRAAAKGLGEGAVNLVLGLLNTVGNASSYQPIATEYRVNFTRPGRIWQRTDRWRDWEYAKEQALNLTVLHPVGRMLGELPASAIVASSSEYSQAARIEASANAGRLTPGFLLTVATGRPALQTAKTIGIRIEAARAAARSPWQTPTALYRTYAEKVIDLTPGHPLKGLLDPSTGQFMRPPSRQHADLIGGPYVEVMHVVSSKAGGTKVAIGDAWRNQIDNVVLEHPSKGGYAANEAVTIGGIQMEKRSAEFLERFGIIPRGSVEGATKASGWTPWWWW